MNTNNIIVLKTEEKIRHTFKLILGNNQSKKKMSQMNSKKKKYIFHEKNNIQNYYNF